MNYKIEDDKIIIIGKEEFNPKHILDCGQVFRFSNIGGNNYEVRVGVFQAKIIETETGYEILASDLDFIINYLDLNKDYRSIKSVLSTHKIIKTSITAGEGLRLLNAPFFETAVNFIISANNNIKRIQLILNRLCESVGKKMNGYFAFPETDVLLGLDESFWRSIGAGYRSKYLPNAIKALSKLTKESFTGMDTNTVRKLLIKLPGIGPKVADCILLFGLQRYDVFPVDVWIEKLYYKHFSKKEISRVQISNELVGIFGELSGYAQQYLFNYRSALAATEIF